MSKLKATITARAKLPQELSAQMFALYEQYYDGTSHDAFMHDLHDKEYVILLYDNHAILRGFSTVAVMETQWGGKPLRAIFSGDTIIHHEYWGEQVLITSWFELAGRIKRKKPDVPLYWFLIVKGHRTYRLLHVFSRDYAPHRTRETQPQIAEIKRHLASTKFGDYYSDKSGLIDFGESRGHLKPQYADAEQFASRNPEVAYFLSRNPEYQRGVELVCLTELTEANLRYYALSGFKKGLYETDSLEQRAGSL